MFLTRLESRLHCDPSSPVYLFSRHLEASIMSPIPRADSESSDQTLWFGLIGLILASMAVVVGVLQYKKMRKRTHIIVHELAAIDVRDHYNVQYKGEDDRG